MPDVALHKIRVAIWIMYHDLRSGVVHGSLFNKAGEIWIMVDCRSRVNKLSVSKDRTFKMASLRVPSDRILPMYIYSHICGARTN